MTKNKQQVRSHCFTRAVAEFARIWRRLPKPTQSLATSATKSARVKAGESFCKRNLWFVVAVVAAVSTLGSSELFAHDAASLVRRANEEMREGNTEQALADYRQAVEAQPDRFEPLYNQAVAHYRMGQFAEARELLTQVLATSDRQLEAKARFNLANCDYSEAVASAEQDRQAAIESTLR